MRKLFLLLAIVFLLQSCFSYRHKADPSALIAGQKYKIERNHKARKFFYTKTTDSALVVSRSRYGKEVQIPLNKVTSIRKKKFSALKTIALIPATMAAVALVFVLTYDGPNINLDGLNSPN
jgi:hypothetical protein